MIDTAFENLDFIFYDYGHVRSSLSEGLHANVTKMVKVYMLINNDL